MKLKISPKALIPSAPAAAAIAAVIIMAAALMLSPVIGVADNGDFYRITNSQGIYKLDRYESDQYFSYAATKFGIYQYFNEYEAGLVSSQTPFIRAALALDKLFTRDSVFDIRFLGGLLLIYCAAAIYFLVDYLAFRASRIAGYVIAAFCVFVFADTGYTAYFNSFYAEGLVMVSFVFMIAMLLLLTQRRYPPYLLLSAFCVNAAILTTSKQQNAPMGVLTGLLLLAVCFLISCDKSATQSQGEKPPYIISVAGFRAAAIAGGIALSAAGVAVYVFIPQEYVNINSYHAMTRGVLMTAENPEKTLEEFGISPQYALLNKSIYYDRNPVIDAESDMLEKEFFSHYSVGSIAVYYLHHPNQLGQMIGLAAQQAWSVRPAEMGNFNRDAGREPGAKTGFFTLYSDLKEKNAPRTEGFIIVWTAMLLILGCREPKRDVVLAFVMLMGISQLFVSIIGAGDADLSKHIFVFGVAFDLATLVSSCSAVSYFTRRADAKRASSIKRLGAAV